MRRLIDIIIRRRGIVIALLIVLTVILSYEMLRVRMNADFTTYLRQDDPLVQQFNYIGKEYASKSVALVLIQTEDVFTPATLKLIRDLTDAYEKLGEIAYVTSLTNVLDFKSTEWGLEVGKLIQEGKIPDNSKELQKLKKYVLSKEMYVKNLVSADGKSTVIVARLKHGVYEFGVTEKIKKITESIAPSSERISYGGMPFLMSNMTLLIIDNLKRLEPIMLLLMLGILFLSFFSLAGVFLPLVVVGFSVIWTIGLMTVFNLSLNLLTGLVPIILIAMGSADGIHVMRRYYEKRGKGLKPTPAIKETFAELAVPIVITTFTTVIGFLSLMISNFSIIREFGLVTALGIFVALIVTFLLFPALLSFTRVRKNFRHKPASHVENRWMECWAEIVFRNRKLILFSSALIVVVSAVAIPRISKSVDWTLCLKKGSKAHRAEMLLRRDFGGTLPVQVLVKGNIKDPFTLKQMRFVERYLGTVPSVGETQSMAGVISEMNRVLNGRYIVPENKEGVANLWFLLEGKDILEQLVRGDKKEGLIRAKLATWDTGTLTEAVNSINKFISTLPKKMVIINLDNMPPASRKVLLRLRGKRITTNLMRDIERRGIQVKREKVNAAVRTALLGEGLSEDSYAVVKEKLREYLLSDESEVEAISPPQAALLAEKITGELRKNGSIKRAQVLAILQSALKGNRKDDVNELSQSLKVVAEEVAGRARVAYVMKQIRKALPAGSAGIIDFFRDIRGDLWEMNEKLIALGVNEYRNLPLIPASSEVREISVSFENTGLAAVLKKMEEELVPTQVLSLFIALILVAITLSFIFRSLSLGAIGIIPISLTILVNFAVMGYFKIGLDSFTAMIASVAIGLGIDTDVHFISAFKREFSRQGDELKALKSTFSTTGVAILINALTVGLGFAVLLLAGGQHIRRFGGLVALTVLLSAFFTFTILPVVILLVKPNFLRR